MTQRRSSASLFCTNSKRLIGPFYSLDWAQQWKHSVPSVQQWKRSPTHPLSVNTAQNSLGLLSVQNGNVCRLRRGAAPCSVNPGNDTQTFSAELTTGCVTGGQQQLFPVFRLGLIAGWLMDTWWCSQVYTINQSHYQQAVLCYCCSRRQSFTDELRRPQPAFIWDALQRGHLPCFYT